MSTVLPAGLARPIPLADGLDAPYWHGTQAHELRVQQCASCSTFRWSPEWLCYACHSFETNWVNVDASGVLFSFQRIWHPASPALAGAGPYITVLVELPQAGNIRMLGAVFEDHGAADQSAEVPYTLVQWTQSNEAP
jgi:uncharacterized OB-fold protein